jgi:hypothetical protein
MDVDIEIDRTPDLGGPCPNCGGRLAVLVMEPEFD